MGPGMNTDPSRPSGPLSRGLILAAGVVLALQGSPPGWAADPLARFQAPPPDPRFQALPRPINYDTPLVPLAGPPAVIVYGAGADRTKEAAEGVRQAVKEWSGRDLDLVSDRQVTSDETWLLTEAYRRTPLIVVGNCSVNRVLHALATRYLAYSNRMWPGGDRYTVRTVFEPFVADVNFVALEASTAEGLGGAVTRLTELLRATPPGPQATFPHTIVAGATTAKWGPPDAGHWAPKPDYADLSGSVSAVAAATQGKPFPGVLATTAMACAMGGYFSDKEPRFSGGKEAARAVAAKVMNDSREWNGRTHRPFDHYGAMPNIIALRCILSCGVLTPEEFTEAENWMALSAADPREYYYDEIGGYDHRMNHEGGRHFASCLLITVTLTDYVANHCRLSDEARREVTRRADGAYRTTAEYRRSFRDNLDTWEIAESTMMELYAMLHQGMPDVIGNGNLRRMADMAVMTNDNVETADCWRILGCYAGLDNYIGSAPGCLRIYCHGRGLIAAAAYYYQDREYLWFLKKLPFGSGPWGSVATPMLPVHYELVAEPTVPTRYDGVTSLPFDPRLYDVVARPESGGGWGRRFAVRLPGPLEKAADRVVFRDGMSPRDAYLLLTTSQRLHDVTVGQNNAIARYTDLGDVWLYHNTMLSTSWSRNVVSVSNGQSFVPTSGCTLEAQATWDDVSLVAAKESGVGGGDWTRTIVHWRGHYFVVLDQVQALADDQLNLVCRWRTPHPAKLAKGAWVATAASGNRLAVVSDEWLPQTSEHRQIDGAARPYVLSQMKSAKLRRGAEAGFHNLVYVSGGARRDEFATRRLGPRAMLISGQADGRRHLALVGVGGALPLRAWRTDALAYHITGGHLRLAEVSSLLAGQDGVYRELLRAARPVNLDLDLATGEATVQARGTEPVALRIGPEERATAVPGLPMRLRLADPSALPDVSGELARLWARAKPTTARPVASTDTPPPPLQASASAQGLERPNRRLEQVAFSATPPTSQPLEFLSSNRYAAWMAGYFPTWRQPDGIELTLDFGQPVAVSHLRLVSTMQPARGTKLYEVGELRFSLALSNDNFRKDLRNVPRPVVTFEETGIYPIFHHDIGRLPTFRVQVGARARYVRVRPVSVNPQKPFVSFQGVEAYGPDRTDDLIVKAFAADTNGDGANELVVGTSNQQVAVHDHAGRQLWSRRLPGDIFTMACADLEEDGKSEVLALTMREMLHCLNGDGSERYRADLNQAFRRKMGDEYVNNNTAAGGELAIGVWAPEGPQAKEVVMPGEVSYRVKASGEIEPYDIYREWGWYAAARMANLYPGEPEALATVGSSIVLFAPRKDDDGNYARLSYKPPAGRPGAPLMHQFAWVKPVDLPGYKGILAANETGLNWCPVDYLASEAQVGGWGFSTGEVPIVAALAEDLDGDGLPEVLLARQDGFVNVLSLPDGSERALLNTGETILGMAVLGGGQRRELAVGTTFGVHLYDARFRARGPTHSLCAAFAGPGGEDDQGVFTVGPEGTVRFWTRSRLARD